MEVLPSTFTILYSDYLETSGANPIISSDDRLVAEGAPAKLPESTGIYNFVEFTPILALAAICAVAAHRLKKSSRTWLNDR